MKVLLVYTIALGMFCAAPAMAQWVEQGDAGDLPSSAQIPAGSGPLTSISGNCGTGDVDMFCIHVDDVQGFLASTCNLVSWDTQLFVFDAAGVGVRTNDDASGCGLQSQVPDLAECGAVAGQFYVAISRFNNDPRDASGSSLFPNSNSCGDNPNPVASWSGTSSSSGDYTIELTGVSYCGGATPVEPSTWGSIKGLYR